MDYWLNSLRAKVRRVLKDPIANVVLNYSVEKAKEYYDKAAKQWESWDYQGWAKVDKHEEISFDFANLESASQQAKEAHNLYTNMLKENKSYIKKLDWYLYGQNFVVSWHRMKTFEEYLHDWIKDALTRAYKDAEWGAKLVLEKELDLGIVSRSGIHCFAEWIIDAETLERLSKFEPATKFDWRDIEKDVEKCIEALNARKEKNETALARKKTDIKPCKVVEIEITPENKKDEEKMNTLIEEIVDLVHKFVKNGKVD